MSRHPTQLMGLSSEEREKLYIDDSEEVTVMRMLVEDLPQALTIEMLKEVVARDQDYQLLLNQIKEGHRPDSASTLQQYVHPPWAGLETGQDSHTPRRPRRGCR